MLFVLSLQIATLHFRHGVFKWCMHFDIKGREARGVLARMVELGGFCFLFFPRVSLYSGVPLAWTDPTDDYLRLLFV